MKVAVYSVVRGGRPKLTARSFGMLRRWAGCDFEHYVGSNGADARTVKMLRELLAAGHIHTLQIHGVNYGQNIAANMLLDAMVEHETVAGRYDLVLRWDDDAIPRTRRFLKQLIKHAAIAAERSGYWSVWSPKITKLKHPPVALTAPGDDIGSLYEIVPILGGICRLHPRAFFDGWRFNKYGALGFGEASEVADRCLRASISMCRLISTQVEHAYGEDGQEVRYPALFKWERKTVSRYLGYGL